MADAIPRDKLGRFPPGVSGNPDKRFKPGVSGNPEGRTSFGASAREWANVMQDASVSELQAILANPKTPSTKATAVIRLLRCRQVVDVAAFEPVLCGTKTLQQLAADGVDTTVVKKITRKETEDATQVTLEFHDWSGAEFDRLMDRTEGRPNQAIQVTDERSRPPAELLEEARRWGLQNPGTKPEPGDS